MRMTAGYWTNSFLYVFELGCSQGLWANTVSTQAEWTAVVNTESWSIVF